jgi:hypothetical protein
VRLGERDAYAVLKVLRKDAEVSRLNSEALKRRWENLDYRTKQSKANQRASELAARARAKRSKHVKPKKTERPTIVCLCGSTRFWRLFQQAGLRETMAGRIVLSIGAASGTDDEHFGNLPRDEYDRIKTMLDELHMRKIDLADEVLILNHEGYIGESTARELAYAQKLGKRVRFWESEQ